MLHPFYCVVLFFSTGKQKRIRSIDVSRLSESDNKAWKGVFNG